MNICKVFDYEDFSSNEFKEVAKLAKFGITRKSWENYMFMCGFLKTGILNTNTIALGLGCLTEQWPFILSNYVKFVHATDTAYGDKPWGKVTVKPEDVYGYAQVDYVKDKISFHNMDMRTITYPDSTFDLVWSSSSIEHTGKTTEDMLVVFKEIERVLKSGGICAITTEWSLDYTEKPAQWHNVFCFNEQVVLSILDSCPTLRLYEPINTIQSDNEKNKDPEYFRGKTHFGPPRSVDFTSASLFFVKE